MSVLVLGGSIRAHKRNSEALIQMASCDGGVAEFAQAGKDMGQRGFIFSNSEILAAAAMRGAMREGAKVEYFCLKNLFPQKERGVVDLRRRMGAEPLDELSFFDTLELHEDELTRLYDLIGQADGVVLSTPVYFGDRSSVANKFMQLTGKRGLLRGKAVGAVSVGAKRNGGQETCNIYTLIEALNQGALCVGNGPPTSQYGGTAVGGNQMHVLDDLWGLETAMGTGRKTAHTASLLSKGGEGETPGKVRVDILVTMDTEARKLAEYLRQLTSQVASELPWVEFHLHELIDLTIYRCLGCKTCPGQPATDTEGPMCAIRDPLDCLETLRREMGKSDAVIVAGLNIHEVEKVIWRYQVTTERMRYIRRNNFELTDLLMAGLCFNHFGATMNPIHSTKVLTSYIRQNTIFNRPVEILEHGGKVLDDGAKSLHEFCANARRIKAGRAAVQRPKSIYVAHGEAGGYK